MKRLFLLLSVILLVSGCYDDSALWESVNDHESRISKLEKLCTEMNTNISSIKTIVEALQKNDYVTSVTPVTEDGKEVGYTITFSKSGAITIYHCKDGADGKDGTDGQTPVVGVRQDADGVYYWTLNGEWLLDDSGNKIPTTGKDGADGQDGKDGITPELKIEDGYWYVSYDNGASWTEVGKATGENGKDGEDGADGDSFFRSVTQDDANVYFTLADGTVITLPKKVSLSIEFDSEDLVVMAPNSTRDIRYTVTSVLPDVEVEALSSGDVQAKVVPDETGESTGVIRVRIPGDSIDEYCKVVVLVSNGEKVIMRTLTFEEEAIEVVDEAKVTANAEGGEVELLYLSNVECEVVIPEDAKSWISVVPATRAMEKRTITLKLEPNAGATRSTTVAVKSVNGKLSLTYTITQEPALDYQLALEREALIAIYNALDGDNWTNNENWCSDRPVSEWAGVCCEANGKVFRLGLTELSGTMRGFIPSEIGNLSHLTYLSLDINTDKEFPAEISNLKELEQIYLWGSSDNARIGFPVGLYDCTNLKIIHISGTGFDVSLSPKVGQLQELQDLYLMSTNISGPLPENIGELQALQALEIRGFGELGELPPSLGNLQNLKHLSLGMMSGDIPKELGQLSNLEKLLFYSTCPITSIPNEIYNIKTLKGLELSFTQFPYAIPDAIGNLTELESLCINYDLTGTIPESMGKLTKLKQLSLANPFPQVGESLSGDVPESLQNLEYWPYFWADVIFGHPYLNTKNLNLPAMHIQAEDLDGNAINTNEIYSNNRLTIIYSWDEICPAVTELHPILKELYSKYHGNGFDVIGYIGGWYEDHIKELVNRFELPWRNFSGQHFPFKNGAVMAPGFISGLVIVVNSSGQVVYETVTGDYNGLKKYVEKVFNDEIQLYESTDYSLDGKMTTLQTATKGDGIDIVLMGDAYSDRQITVGTYKNDMENLYNNLFIEEPYKSFKDHFNVYYVNVVSKNEGYGTYSETALAGYFGDGTLVGGNDNAVFNYALNAISREDMDEALIIVAMNSDNYAGTCYMYYPTYATGTYGSGPSVAYFPKGGDQETFAQLLHHEACGHGFAKLADEYAYEDMGAVSGDYEAQTARQQNEWGWWKNVDFTNDPSQVRWSHFLEDERYQYDGLGCFEGGLTYWSGVWRPTENSIMRYNTGGFNAPSREAIWYRIHKLAYGDSWEYDYEDFVEYDAVNRASSASAPQKSRGNYVERRFEPTAPPVVVNKSWREAK